MEPSGYRLPPNQKYDRIKLTEGVTLVKPPVRVNAHFFDESDLFPNEREATPTPKQIAPPPPRPDDK